MSRLSEVRSLQQEREKAAARNNANAEMKDLYGVLTKINGNLEDLSASIAMLVDEMSKK